MTADMIVDFESHLDHGKVWLVSLELPMQDAPDDVPDFLDVDLYVTADSIDHAQYLACCMYPDNIGCSINEQPVTKEEYANRGNRGIL